MVLLFRVFVVVVAVDTLAFLAFIFQLRVKIGLLNRLKQRNESKLLVRAQENIVLEPLFTGNTIM